MRKQTDPVENHIAAVLAMFDEFEDAGAVIVELAGALVAVITIAAHDKRDAQRTLNALTRDLKEMLDREYDAAVADGDGEHRAGHA